MIPGELLIDDGELVLNTGRRTQVLTIANTGDRPIQVGSHYHFFETNTALRFDRKAALGYRLNIAAGTAVRFEPGQERSVELVELAGDRVVYGFNARVSGPLDKPDPESARFLPRSRGRVGVGASASKGAVASKPPPSWPSPALGGRSKAAASGGKGSGSRK